MMTPGVNPYAASGAIRRLSGFFGRQDELNRLYNLIAQRHFSWVTGERRSGRSSLLFALIEGADEFRALSGVDWRFAAVNCLSLALGGEADFVLTVLDQLALAMEFDWPGLLDARRQLNAARDNPPGRDIASMHEALRRWAHEARRARPHQQGVIVMDNVDELIVNPRFSRAFFGMLRGWAQTFGVPFVTTSQDVALDGLVDTNVEAMGSSFFNVPQMVYLGPLTREEARDLIETPALVAGRPFDLREIAWIKYLAGRHPYLLQMACEIAFDAVVADRRPMDTQAFQAEFAREASGHMRLLFDRLDASERDQLAILAVGRPMRSETIERALIRRGIIIADDDSRRIFSPLFTDLISNEHPRAAGRLIQAVTGLATV